MKRLICLYLDILAVPTIFMNKKRNALFHLKSICPKCPKFRRKMRDVNDVNECWWYLNWKKRNYTIPRFLGLINWISQYLLLRTNLKRYRKL